MKKTKKTKLKTYVITLMVKFPAKAPFLANKTEFKKKVLSGEKKHTIRRNYKFWKKRIDKINEGKAVLSLRQWSGLPYRSEQKEIMVLKKGEVGYQRITMTGHGWDVAVGISKNEYKFLSDRTIKRLVKNDGITMEQFREFFKEPLINGIIIHLTKLRY